MIRRRKIKSVWTTPVVPVLVAVLIAANGQPFLTTMTTPAALFAGWLVFFLQGWMTAPTLEESARKDAEWLDQINRDYQKLRTVEDRLDELERLKRRDMVTPEEYAAKRQEILKDL